MTTTMMYAPNSIYLMNPKTKTKMEIDREREKIRIKSVKPFNVSTNYAFVRLKSSYTFMRLRWKAICRCSFASKWFIPLVFLFFFYRQTASIHDHSHNARDAQHASIYSLIAWFRPHSESVWYIYKTAYTVYCLKVALFTRGDAQLVTVFHWVAFSSVPSLIMLCASFVLFTEHFTQTQRMCSCVLVSDWILICLRGIYAVWCVTYFL